MFEPHVAPPTAVTGTPSILREAVVVTINTDGTVDLKATDSRTGWTQMTLPGWYVPTVGDHVVVGDLQGDPQQAAVIAPASGRVYSPPPLVTSLTPGQAGIPSPVPDGFEVRYLADATNGVLWSLRYRAASASAYKWEFTGGSPLYVETMAPFTTASSTFVDSGPSLTVPQAGDYDFEVGGDVFSATAGEWAAFVAYRIGAVAGLDDDAFSGTIGTSVRNESGVKTRRKNISTASTLVMVQARTNSLSTDFYRRTLRVMPVRVG